MVGEEHTATPTTFDFDHTERESWKEPPDSLLVKPFQRAALLGEPMEAMGYLCGCLGNCLPVHKLQGKCCEIFCPLFLNSDAC